MKKLAIIPARSGSKRIPNKNIKDFLGKPIIVYSIETVIESNLFDEVMVSTNDETIAQLSEKYGAQVPFIRSDENSGDFASTPDVIYEVLTQYNEIGKIFDTFCCVYPTAPFISVNRLKECCLLLINKNYDSVFPIIKYQYPIQRALTLDNQNVFMEWPENYFTRSQDLRPYYHDAGQFYWMWTKRFFVHRKMFTDNSGAIIIPSLEAQDIDEISDWKIAEMKYKYLTNQV